MTTPKSHPDDTPPSARIRDRIRLDEEARKAQAARVDAFGARLDRVEDDAARALEGTARFDWKLNLILGGVGASFVAILAMAAWTLTSLQKATSDTRSIAAQEARAIAIGAFDEERKHFQEVVAAERTASVRALLDEQRKQSPGPGLLTSRAP